MRLHRPIRTHTPRLGIKERAKPQAPLMNPKITSRRSKSPRIIPRPICMRISPCASNHACAYRSAAIYYIPLCKTSRKKSYKFLPAVHTHIYTYRQHVLPLHHPLDFFSRQPPVCIHIRRRPPGKKARRWQINIRTRATDRSPLYIRVYVCICVCVEGAYKSTGSLLVFFFLRGGALTARAYIALGLALAAPANNCRRRKSPPLSATKYLK